MAKTGSKKRKIIIFIVSAVAVIALLFGACAVYLGDYYHAIMPAVEAFELQHDGRQPEITGLDNGNIVCKGENATEGLIFYPGGKVEYTAYLPLMESLAQKGILCVLVRMPFNLAVFDVNAADGIRELFPEITDWYIGGHSLGGSMAAAYLEKHPGDFKGLLLLAAYSTADLSNENIKTLSIYGSEDGVLNREKYEQYRSNLPELTEYIIDGGCHAYFGVYGEQDGDGTPTIDNARQINLTADKIAEWVG